MMNQERPARPTRRSAIKAALAAAAALVARRRRAAAAPQAPPPRPRTRWLGHG